MKKRLLVATAAAAMSMVMSMTAFASMGNWQQDATGWWWQRTDNSYPADEWKWIDGNGDGTAESYYFDQNGYLITNTTTPDGYTVNADGAWVQDGVVQTKAVNPDLGGYETVVTGGVTTQTADSVVTDGKSIEQIVVNPELFGMIGANGMDKLPNMTEISQGWLNTYSVDYNGVTLRVEADPESRWLASFYGPAKTLFNNFPSQGIELNAFYDSCGYESNSTGRRVMASTGRSDEIFGLPGGSYRMGWGSVDGHSFNVLLTAGTNNTWYIYPDSPVILYN